MRAGDYPIPDYACYVWSRGDALMVAFPDRGTLAIPAEKLTNDTGMPAGFKALWDLLNGRRNEILAGKKPIFATKTEPTQEMLAHAMRIAKASPPKSTLVEEDIFAEDY